MSALESALPVCMRRNEVQLVLACARTDISEKWISRIIELCQAELDWDAVIRVAGRQRVTPLLYRSLTLAGAEPVPPGVLSQLRLAFLNNTRHSLMLAHELLRVLRRLHEQHMTVLAFRGPSLAKAMYGSLSLRRFNDLDVLLHKEDILRAVDLLADLGYSSGGVPASQAARLETMYHYALRGHAGDVHLELHWRLTPRYFGVSLDQQTWERAQWIELQGQQVPTLGDEDLLLALCVHGSKHSWSQLSWICDVAELVRARPRLDWASVIERARQLEVERMLSLGLYLASHLLTAPLPFAALALAGSDREALRLGHDVCEELFGDSQRSTPSSSSLLLKDFHLRLRETPWRKVRHVARTAFIPTHEDWNALPLPRSLSFMYYLLRPLRLLAKHARRQLAKNRSRGVDSGGPDPGV